ncbi:MAG: tetratricopeptide repeat protein [Flavobacterium sp. JAD_PAG50586_2]|nr:MAG: tetratricopeptide repeat protein [Flavobacterium sp. JAD_PAG50586_2]
MVQKKDVIILILLANCALAQLPNNSRFDSISDKSYDYLKSKFEETIFDKDKSKIYVSAWLQKAKAEKNNYLQLALAYRASAFFAEKSLQLRYADSMISNAKRVGNDELIGSSFMTKGILYYNRNEHSKALDNYLIADRYITKSDIPSLNFQIKYGIAQIKYYLGFYDEAISLYSECSVFFEDENDRMYLNALHGLALCYTHIGKHQLATETNLLGIENGRLFEDTGMEFYFNHSEGINQCCIGNYTDAIKKLKTVLPEIIRLNDFTNEAAAYFYLGKSYWSLKRYSEAIKYFKKVDYIFQKEKHIIPDLRKGYEYLIDYYKEKDDTQSQLFYINQLLKVDKVLAQDYKYLLKKIVKEYDTKELLSAKNAIENKMVFVQVAACIIVLLMTIIIMYLVRKNKINQKLFKELMNRNTALPEETVCENPEIELPEALESDNNNKVPTPDISLEIEEAIIKKLEKFEGAKKYLEKDMTLSKMATILHTNSKYVTKVIAKHRGQRNYRVHHRIKVRLHHRNAQNRQSLQELHQQSTWRGSRISYHAKFHPGFQILYRYYSHLLQFQIKEICNHGQFRLICFFLSQLVNDL